MIKWLLMTSLTGSVASLLFILLRTKLAAKYGGRWYYYACLLTFALFILPLHVNLSFIQSQFSFFENRIQTNSTTAVKEAAAAAATSMPEQMATTKTSVVNDIFSVLSVDQWILGIWIAGCLAMLYRYLFGYFRFKKLAIQSSPIDSFRNLKVVVSDYVHSPMLIGFFNPKIVIPNTEINEEDYKLALQHEWIHYKQGDVWFKLMAVLVNCLHWFNPISYLALANISEACEYAVDEQITKGLKPAEKKRYSEMILHFASSMSPVLNSNLGQHKKQLYRRFTLIMKRSTGSKKMILGFMVVALIAAVSVFSSSIVFAKKSMPLTEYGGAIKTYYNTSITLEENIQTTLGNRAIRISYPDMYIDADGLKIDYYNRSEPYYKVVRQWHEKKPAFASMTNKSLSIEGQTVTVVFNDQAKDYINDKVINQMIINQITFELSYQNKKYKYDHNAFIKEVIKRGVYVIEEVATPKQFTYNLSKTQNGAFVGNKLLTSYDKKNKITNIFNGTAKLPKTINNEVNQGVQLGTTFVIKNGETLAINIKELTDKMPTINLAIWDETTDELAYSIVNASIWNRNIFTPGDNEANHSFKVVASGEEKDNVGIEIYTYKTGKEEVNVTN